MTLGPKIEFSMSAVLRNLEIRGTTAGSRAEFTSMLRFVEEKQIRPLVSKVVYGMNLNSIEELFENMRRGTHFGKLVVALDSVVDTPKL
jgi:D-arabinose 1-dehydrogenase-like Zn-dependent alcohol dehydrogenase